jgi:hypothetical protein
MLSARTKEHEMDFLSSNFFWFLMGILFVLIAAGFKAFAEGKGWVISWWKWILSIVWYGILMVTIYSAGVLFGENETAWWRILLLGLFVTLILGVGLWRLLMIKPKEAAPVKPTPAPAEA